MKIVIVFINWRPGGQIEPGLDTNNCVTTSIQAIQLQESASYNENAMVTLEQMQGIYSPQCVGSVITI